jgi:hemoglobin
MRARVLIAASVLIGGLGVGAARADDPPAKKSDDIPAKKAPSPPLERSELDKRAASTAFEASKLGSELWLDKDYKGAFRLYQGTLMALQPMFDHRPKLAAFIKLRLDKAQDMKAEEGAFVLREALDAIRKEVVEAPIVVPKKAALWERLGGEKTIKAVIHDFLEAAMKDPKVNFTRDGKFKLSEKRIAEVEEHLVELVSEIGRGPIPYAGRDIRKTHTGMNITDGEFDALVGHLAASLKKNKVAEADADELIKTVKEVKIFIVGK